MIEQLPTWALWAPGVAGWIVCCGINIMIVRRSPPKDDFDALVAMLFIYAGPVSWGALIAFAAMFVMVLPFVWIEGIVRRLAGLPQSRWHQDRKRAAKMKAIRARGER